MKQAKQIADASEKARTTKPAVPRSQTADTSEKQNKENQTNRPKGKSKAYIQCAADAAAAESPPPARSGFVTQINAISATKIPAET
ncbi:hypothetical protein PTKU64_18270 [Paraburkholderia terrae]|uniref:Uncharacterized protein n=1 Tax=Paraburkholderia terrae TaxID=311230 RepID=A0ABM7TGX0_9BURK|nr:hypothetical protein PTKU64_18270 [Paraburkholderia terrae]